MKALVVRRRAGVRGDVRPRDGAAARRPRAQRAQAAQHAGAEFRLATADEVLEAQGVEPGFVGPVPTPLPVYADEALRRGHYVAGANKPDTRPASGSSRCRRPTSPTCARRAPATPARTATASSRGARDRGRQHLPARHQVLGADGRHVPRRGGRGAGHRHGQLRHRPGAHRRRRRRAAPRRERHRLAGGHRPVPGAPGARARRGRDAGRAGRASSTRAQRRRASRCSTTTAT